MGLILVFDMDQTIIDSSDPYLFERPNTPEANVILKQKIRQALNWNVVNIMKRAAKLRPDDGVTAICLLTNNSSTILVSAVDEVLYEEIGSRGKYKTYRGNVNDRGMPDKPYFFDSIMMRQHTSRPKTVDDNPPKRLVDVLNMLQFIGIKAGPDSIKDIYFFDDIGTHALRPEFNFMADGKYKDHYIQITPPYNVKFQDRTDYRSILDSLANLDKEQPSLPTRPLSLRNANSKPSTNVLPAPTPYRPRSNAKVNEINLNLLPAPQEQSVRAKASIKRSSLLGAFSPAGGSRYKKSRKFRHLQRKRTRRTTKKNH